MAFTDPFPGLGQDIVLTEKQDLIRALRLDLAAELEATNTYTAHADACRGDFPEIAAAIDDVADEEKVHAGEFVALINALDKAEGRLIEKGTLEVAKKYPDLGYNLSLRNKER
ncbi:MAG: ferritin family protein [Dehalococcoidales bacterium]|nr:ferritin family protein [Dehalococcoidales bacterium]